LPLLDEHEKKRTGLKGQNRIAEFRRIVGELTTQLSKEKKVVGIVLSGGVVRGFVDKFSDLDVTVFLDKKDDNLCRSIRNLSSRMTKPHSADLDLMIHYLGDLRKWKMNEGALRWEYANAKIILDTRGEIKEILEEKLRPPKDFWIRRIVAYSEYIRWYCCPSEEGTGTIAESWIERGDIASAHYCLDYSVELLLRLLFAMNQQFVPAPKWRLFYSSSLKWTPKDYDRLIQEAMITKSLSLREFNRRLRAIRRIWHQIATKIQEETGLTSKTISKYYVERILQQKIGV